jgi:glycerate 2-kinase
LSTLREDAQSVIDVALTAAQPKNAVLRALAGLRLYEGRLRVISIGKAAWTMAEAAVEGLGARIDQGLAIVPYGYSRGPLPRFAVMEAGYPMPDESSVLATDAAIAMAQGLDVEDTVLVLISGGGSSLFERPLIPLPLYATTIDALYRSGASITEMNVIRRRLSAVKGGRFAKLCAPASVVGLVLSDVLGDAPETVASGPVSPDPVASAEAESTLLRLLPDAPELIRALMRRETPKELSNAETHLIGNVGLLVRAAARALRKLGYETVILTDRLNCEAREAGRFLASIALSHQGETHSVAYLVGGETTVRVNGSGQGGRNQELALAAAKTLEGLGNTGLFAIDSDGLDGPTDAAGAYVDHRTASRLRNAHIDIAAALQNNDSYNALRAVGGLIKTGATGTSVNDIAALLLRR